jgi:hypothetical protein
MLSCTTKKVVSTCPVCSGELLLGRLECTSCSTRIETRLAIPAFFRLPEDLQHFVMVFLACRGNIREAEKVLGISYPTVCKRLDLVNELLGNKEPAPASQDDILTQLEKGEISPQQAAQLLRKRMAP